MILLEKLAVLNDRYEYLQSQLSDPSVVSDISRYMKVSRESKNLESIAEAFKKYKLILSNIESAKEILATADDAEFIAMAKMELAELEPQVAPLEEEIRVLLIPKDPDDERDVTIEIRSGTGGDEAAIFAGDLLRMIERFVDRKGWRKEFVAMTESESGGYSKAILQVFGDNVYGTLKYESGTHRVQRVPKTEAQGRVHTSAATIVILPIVEIEEVQINAADLEWDVFRASGAGGQHVNRTESAVRVTHKPTGTVVECQEGRSQIKNREIALQKLYVLLKEKTEEAHNSQMSELRRSLVASGDRSAKIRTYNYPQSRITDHRISFTKHNLPEVMNGDLDDFIHALQNAYNAEKLQATEEE
jgi:peptide chain release factor 1